MEDADERCRTRDRRLEAWERLRAPGIAAGAVPDAGDLCDPDRDRLQPASTGSLLIDAGAVRAARLGCMFTLHPLAGRPRRMAVFLAGASSLIMMAVLVIRVPWFGFFTFTGYFYAFYRPARASGGCSASRRWP